VSHRAVKINSVPPCATYNRGDLAERRGAKMNWRTGLFRVWIVASVCWLGFAFWFFGSSCVYFSDSSIFNPACATGAVNGIIPVAQPLTAFSLVDWLRWLAFVIAPPLAALVIGVIARWVIKGFGQRPK